MKDYYRHTRSAQSFYLLLLFEMESETPVPILDEAAYVVISINAHANGLENAVNPENSEGPNPQKGVMSMTVNYIALSAGTVEYTDWI